MKGGLEPPVDIRGGVTHFTPPPGMFGTRTGLSKNTMLNGDITPNFGFQGEAGETCARALEPHGVSSVPKDTN